MFHKEINLYNLSEVRKGQIAPRVGRSSDTVLPYRSLEHLGIDLCLRSNSLGYADPLETA